MVGQVKLAEKPKQNLGAPSPSAVTTPPTKPKPVETKVWLAKTENGKVVKQKEITKNPDPEFDRKVCLATKMFIAFLVLGAMDFTMRCFGNYLGSQMVKSNETFAALGDWYKHFIPAYYTWILFDCMMLSILSLVIKDSCFTHFLAFGFNTVCVIVHIAAIVCSVAFNPRLEIAEMDDVNNMDGLDLDMPSLGWIRLIITVVSTVQMSLLLVAENHRDEANKI